MVKIPSLDDLKKVSSDLMDSAKAAGFGGVIERLKSSIESVGVSMGGSVVNEAADPVNYANLPLSDLLQSMRADLVQLSQMQIAQTELIKKIDTQFIQLTQAIHAATPATVPPNEAKP
jgi:hypothetical protein